MVSYEQQHEKAIESRRLYYQALGRFIDNFARMEVLLKRFLIKMLKVDDAVGRVVTGGLRADNLATYVLRTNEITPLPGSNPAFVEEAVKHFSAINTVRNDILHAGAILRDGKLVISNAPVARTPTHKHEFTVSEEQIQQMADDLDKMLPHFFLCLMLPTQAAELRPKVQFLLDRAWRSKPTELMNRSPKSPKDAQK